MSILKTGSSDASATEAVQEDKTIATKVRRTIIGPPRRLDEKGLFHKVSLVAVLAWVGLGADGLSSAAYGPEEAFKALGEHKYLAIALAFMTAFTVCVLSAAYARIIEKFPHGGGGYLVATKLLGKHAGLTSGCALLIDYVLTVTVSVAASGDALFSVLPPEWAGWKLPFESAMLLGLTILNIRGIRESVIVLAPVFFLFVITHTIVIGCGIVVHAPEIKQTATAVVDGAKHDLSSMGLLGLIMLILHAFSMGGGTYTGIEAVSNGIPMMRHPQAETAKKTMLYMAVSLALTASGLLVCYLLWHIEPREGKTMNAVLVETLTHNWPGGKLFTFVTMLSSAALLGVAAQAGFADGPRVLGNMAIDSWVPRRFSSLCERLTTQNGIMLVGAAALAALLYTRGEVAHLVVMYSINVFVTFSLSLLGMLISTIRERQAKWVRDLILFGIGLALCLVVLYVTVKEKFMQGGWLTLVATGALVIMCLLTRRHYDRVTTIVVKAFAGLEKVPTTPPKSPPVVDPTKPTAVMLVAGYGGLGLHTLLNAFRLYPNHFKNVVFVSVGVIDSGGFKGEESLDELKAKTSGNLLQYVHAAQNMGIAADYRMAVGTDPVEEVDKLCQAVAKEFPMSTFVAGHLLFERDSWVHRLLHNQTAYAIQRRLQWAGLNMLILPARIMA